jgi:serine/threonine protein kinase
MDPARWQQIERLYHEALARPAEVRPRFLAEACAGDEGIRHDVQVLLETSGTGEGVFAGPAVAMAAQMVRDSDASVLTGRRLGVYELKERIGAGGMGEVYRARDMRLGRDVAIKILPRAFTSDPDRLARFEREARVLAALNHPNIATIHGLEEADAAGPAEAGHHVRGLVMELVEGETLAERIARGPIPIPDALDIGKQITEALESAHDKGIVHRDLKPANIKITSVGVVKVLDFGLAKVVTDEGDGSQAPTVTIDATREGTIMGTAAYMSPEQARGLAVDKRTDVWAFGCVLYEMLTGRAAFARATVSDTIAAILERQPEWTALSPDTPPSVVRVLQRCIAKDPRSRLRDVGDARLEIESVGHSDATALREIGHDKAPRRISLAWYTVAAVAAAGLTGFGAATFFSSRGDAPRVNVGQVVRAAREGNYLSLFWRLAGSVARRTVRRICWDDARWGAAALTSPARPRRISTAARH